ASATPSASTWWPCSSSCSTSRPPSCIPGRPCSATWGCAGSSRWRRSSACSWSASCTAGDAARSTGIETPGGHDLEGPYIQPLPPRPVVDRLKERFPVAVLDVTEFRGEITVLLAKEPLLEVARFLRDDPETAFDMLSVVTGTHYLERDYDH